MEIDWTIVAFEVLNFGVLVVLLRRFLFVPVRNALEQRRELIEKNRIDVEQREAAAEELRADYERRRRDLQLEITAQIERAASEGRERADGLVEEARHRARELVATAQGQIDDARRRSLEQLRTEVIGLATDAAARVVRHMDAPQIAAAYARRAAHGFAEIFSDALPEEITAQTGDDADPEQIETELRAVFGPKPRLALTIDPSIVAGVRLRGQGHEVEASVTTSLKRWYAEQVGDITGAEARP